MLLLLLLLIPPTLCQERKLFRSELIFDVTPNCTKPGTNIHFTKTVQCPCFITFGLSSIPESATTVDFLVLEERNFQTWRDQNFTSEPSVLPTFSFFSKSTYAYSFLHKFHYFQTGNLELPHKASYTLTIRTHGERKDCDIKILHIFEAQPTPCPTRLPRLTPQNVVAGIPGDEELTRHMASIISSQGICSGTVIGGQYLLTAAHCAPYGGKAFVGGTTTTSGKEYDIVDFIPHPGYKASSDGRLEAHDIGIVRLSKNISNGVRYSKVMPPSGVFVRAAGYGQITEGWISGSERSLRMVDIAVMQFRECIDRFAKFGARGFTRGLVEGSHVCVGGDCGDTCFGDSGGPIMVNDGAGYVQVGIVSGGIGCARQGLPGIYTKLDRYNEWVRRLTGVSGVVLKFDKVEGVSEDGGTVVAGGERMKIVGLGIVGASVGLGAVLFVGLLIWGRWRRHNKSGCGTSSGVGDHDEQRERAMTFSRRDLEEEERMDVAVIDDVYR